MMDDSPNKRSMVANEQETKIERDEKHKGLDPVDGPFHLLMQLILRLGRLSAPLLILLLCMAGCLAVFSVLPEATKQSIIERVADFRPNYVKGASFPGIVIDEKENIIDLRSWTAPRHDGDEKCCKATWDIELKARRILEDVTQFVERVATTGTTPDATSRTHSISGIEIEDRQRSGGPAMKRFNVFLDVAKQTLDEQFSLHLRTVRYGGFSDEKTEWAASAIMHPTKRVSFTIYFPVNKPARNIRFSASPRLTNRNYAALAIDEQSYSLRQDGMLQWTIDHPELGYAYRIDWDW